MNKSVVAYLITQTTTRNDYGVTEYVETKRKVFCKIASIGWNEWFEGGRNGLNPQFRFTMFSHDYKGEEILEYEGTRYAIYRTYFKSVDEIELYTELKKGIDNG